MESDKSNMHRSSLDHSSIKACGEIRVPKYVSFFWDRIFVDDKCNLLRAILTVSVSTTTLICRVRI